MNKHNKDYERELDLDSQNSLKLISKRLRDNAHVLEFGPAQGVLTKYMKESRQCVVDIVEYNEIAGQEAAKYARKAFLGPEEGDAENHIWSDGLAGEKYDFILFADVLEHLHEPEEILGRCKEFLKEDGAIIISVPNIANNNIILSLLHDEFNYTPTGLLDDTHIKFFTYTSLCQLADRLGLGISYCDYVPGRVGSWEFEKYRADFVAEDLSFISEHKYGNMYQLLMEMKVTEEENKYFREVPPLHIPYGYYSQKGAYSIGTEIEYDKIECYDDVYYVRFSVENLTLEDKFRFDPVEWMPCCLELLEVRTDLGACEVIASNAVMQKDRLFYFTTTDPIVEFRIPDNQIRYIDFRYKISRLDVMSLGREFTEKVQTVQRDLKQLEDVCKIKDSVIQELNNTISDRDKAISDRDKAIKDRDNTISDRDNRIREREQMIADKEREIIARDSVIAARDDEISAIKSTRGYKFLENVRRIRDKIKKAIS